MRNASCADGGWYLSQVEHVCVCMVGLVQLVCVYTYIYIYIVYEVIYYILLPSQVFISEISLFFHNAYIWLGN
jgi:hypothetical protein